MQITFSREEFVDMLSSLWGIPLGINDLTLDFDELTGDVKTFTVKGMNSLSLARIGTVTQAVAPKPQRQKAVIIPNAINYITPNNPVEEEDPTPEEDSVDLDEVLRLSRELALQSPPRANVPDSNQNDLLMYPGASDTFPLEFANRVLEK
jgi:hypothetical protein